MLNREIKRVFTHIRWPLQSYALLGFLFGIVVSKTPFSMGLLLGLLSWLFLCAGITLFNSYYDKDKGPVAGLEKPPETSKSMLYGSLLFKGLGMVISLFLNYVFLITYLIVFILSILYSHRWFRFKSNGYVAVLFNFIMGATTFLVASSFVGIEREILVGGILTSGLFLASIYLMMQVHQKEEDKERKDISIAVMYGRNKTIGFSIFVLFLAAISSIITVFLSSIGNIYIWIFILFFLLLLVFSFFWLRKENNDFSDFRTMNKLTLSFSYIANILLICMYVLEVLII